MTVVERLAKAVAAVTSPVQLRVAESPVHRFAPDSIKDEVRHAGQERYARLVRSDIAPLPGQDPKIDKEIIQSLIRAAQ